MWDWLADTGAWVVTSCLIVAGLAGVFLPFLPGHLLIFLAAAAHWWMLGADAGVEWWTLVVLGLLLVGSQVVEYLSGAVGTRWFGGSKWGAAGAVAGGLVGIFFAPFGLLLGPLIGAFLLEWIFAKKKMKPATVSGVGSVIGTVGGLIVKVVIAGVMVVYFFVDVFLIG
ncbi:MAG: DUF456 domain-containing protein [Akkermansiaceae bacterium]|nr:DUF456 domain-containing protein [Akkermansiaceae bacterium]NNM28174.1 DUF456 domain-containing protein [Akkermansiaceae bacterium]